MAEQGPADKIPLTIHLSPEVARRLKAAAEALKRPATEVVADLLDRHLPRPSAQKGKIPYT
jgi:predicted transcriptional regulator